MGKCPHSLHASQDEQERKLRPRRTTDDSRDAMNEITSDRTHITCVSANAYYEYSCMLSLAVQCNCVVYYLVHKRKTIADRPCCCWCRYNTVVGTALSCVVCTVSGKVLTKRMFFLPESKLSLISTECRIQLRLTAVSKTRIDIRRGTAVGRAMLDRRCVL